MTLGGSPAFPGGLPFARPLTPPLDRVMARLAPSYERGVLTNGPLVAELEEAVAGRLGRGIHAVAVGNCTAGLMLALRALAPAGPVVLPSFTFSASAHAVAWNGLTPRFAECHPASFQLDVADAAARLDGAGGLLATHVFGAPCPAEELEGLAGRAGLPLVFDAAHAMGATRAGRPVGTFGDAEVFSLSPTKMVVAGEGGIVATRHQAVADAIRIGRDYGNPGDYDTRFVGLNARLSELHAAMALESLAGLDDHLARRRTLAARYAEGLAEISGLRPQAVAGGDQPTFKDFALRVDDGFGLSRDELARALLADGIDTRPYFDPPVHRQQAYAGLDPSPLPITDDTAARALSLPMFAALTDHDVDTVVEVIAAIQARAAA
jgi:dTDP-4-amino-4,6-dideoxygalactose transaminase